MSCRIVLVVAACLGLCASLDASADAADDQRAFDAAFDDTMRRYALPGLAVGIVVGGKVVYARTAGERAIGEGQPITRRTLFKIASNSKAMTTAMLARLVDAGKLSWTDPVVRHLPGFRMHDAWVTREIQVRDLLIHNSGLREGAGDLMLWPEPNAFTRADIIAGLAYLKPQHSFRSRYAYDNLLYIVAGEVAAAAGGASYETLVRREVFAPLGMTRCRVGAWSLTEAGDVAQPHGRIDGKTVVMRRDEARVPASTSAAAGGIRCSLDDMLAWMRAMLSEDTAVAGNPWLSPAQREAMWTPQIALPVSRAQREWDDTHFSAYGYGWRLSDVDGELKVAHTGTLFGMYSSVILLPERDAGIVMMTNGEGSTARVVLGQALVKHFTQPGAGRTVGYYADWLAREEAANATAASGANASAAAADGGATTATAREPAAADALRGHLGVYRDAWFGEVSICAVEDAVRFTARKAPLLAGTVMRVGENILVDWDDPSVDAEAWLGFAASRDRRAPALTMAKVDPEADFSYDYEDLAFDRVGDCPRR